MFHVDHYPSTEKPLFKYPHMVERKDGKLVPVVHAYAFSKYLGVLMVEFDDKGNVLNATGNPLLLDNAVQKGSNGLTTFHYAYTYVHSTRCLI